MAMVEIGDNNFTNFLDPTVDGKTVGKGWLGMWPPHAPHESGTFSDLGIKVIPENEWDDRIRQLEKDEATIKQLCLGSGLTVLNQSQTNYCWINAPTFCCMVNRLVETGQCVRYSPASAGARIKSFRNVGGWGRDGLEFMRENGVNEQTHWPPNAIDRKYDTRDNHERAKKNVVLEYHVLNDWNETASCILSGHPVAVGYNWWGHEVTAVGIVIGSHDLIIANSWGENWSEQGYGVLKDRKKIPDDAVAITSMVAS